MICAADGSLYVLNGQHRTETGKTVQKAKNWRTGNNIAMLTFSSTKHLWGIRAKVAGLQQSGSHSLTWIPLLDNMLLYGEDQKREKEPHDFDRFKTAVVQAATKSAFVAPESLEEPGHRVCVGVSHSRTVLQIFSS